MRLWSCFWKRYDTIKEKNKDIEEKNIKIILYYLAQNKNINMNATNKTKIQKYKRSLG